MARLVSSLLSISMCIGSLDAMEQPTKLQKVDTMQEVFLRSNSTTELARMYSDNKEENEKIEMLIEDQQFLDRKLYDLALIDTDEARREMLCMLNYGADTTVHDMNGCTPVHRACRAGNLRGLLILNFYQAQLHTPDPFHWNALHYAIADYEDQRAPKRAEIITFLVQKGLNKYVPVYYSALQRAVSCGDFEATQALILAVPFNKELSLEQRIAQEARSLHKLFAIGQLAAIARKANRLDILELVSPEQTRKDIRNKLLNANIKRAQNNGVVVDESSVQQAAIQKRGRKHLEVIPYNLRLYIL